MNHLRELLDTEIRKNHQFIVRWLLFVAPGLLLCANARGYYPIHTAARVGSVTMMKLLQKCGADLQACDDNHWTPLHHAAECGRTRVTQLLLDQSALTAAVSHKSVATPLEVAQTNGFVQIAKMLQDAEEYRQHQQD